tara:strand:+ start:501 stop:698 length:198 start_codon:yes stop_codon:yes gene_type:complete
MILNYLFIGFIFVFLLDVICLHLKDHKAFKNVPEWGWKERIALILFWPLGIIVFIWGFVNERFGK